MVQIQNSYQDETIGTLYVVPTPIGNLEDITFRALKILKAVQVIAAEDTRQTRKLLTHFEIHSPLVSYNEHNHKLRSDELIDRLRSGEQIALVSDAGMPAISDPGYDLVQTALAADINTVVLPGANAAICAVVGSGLPTDEFLFHGFLPRKKQDKLSVLRRLKHLQGTLIFYESPYRVKETLTIIAEQLGNRHIAIARELTKLYEQYIRGDVASVLSWVSEHELKGECCIVVKGSDGEQFDEAEVWWAKLSVADHVAHYETEGLKNHKEALKQVAVDRQVSRRDIYQQIHVSKP